MPPKGVTRISLFAFVLLLFSMAASNALAQDINPRLSFFGGASLVSASRSFVVGPNIFTSQFNNGIKIGVRGTANINEHWGAEAAYSFSSSGLQITQVAPSVPVPVLNYGVHLHQFTGNALYFFTSRDNVIRPFVTAGLGVSRYSPTSDAKLNAAINFLGRPAVLTGTSEFDFNFGAGVETEPWDHFGLRFDFRDHLTGFPRFGLPESVLTPGAAFFPVSGRVQDFELTAGFVFYFESKL